MLHIRYGDCIPKTTIRLVGRTFDTYFKSEWLKDPIVQELIMGIDKTEVVQDKFLMSPVLGPISHKDLSGGVKACILMYKAPSKEYYATVCGDNCAPWIQIGRAHV